MFQNQRALGLVAVNFLKILILFVAVAMGSSAQAKTIIVKHDKQLQQALNTAQSGDELVIKKGNYFGNFIVPVSVTLRGEEGAIIDANGSGRGLSILAKNVQVYSLEIINWGDDLTEMDAGIYIAEDAAHTRIEAVSLHGITFGILVDAAKDVALINNKIQGVTAIRSQDRGNGIHLFNVRRADVRNNEIWHTRDGIYIDNSSKNELVGNYLHDLRYGVHYMYSYNNTVVNNVTRRTRTGYALMQSKFLTVTGNLSDEDTNYGVLMNFITQSKIVGNRIIGVQNDKNSLMRAGVAKNRGGEAKALFMYNSLFNEIRDNLFSESDIGIHLTAGSEDNVITGNAFIGNREQVKYVATVRQDWSLDGRGNYWSDYLGWDMDSDGTGDTHYEPNDEVDKLLWKFPAAKLLFNSPAIETLRWVQRQFPVLKSEGVVDSHPLMAIPPIGQLSQSNTTRLQEH